MLLYKDLHLATNIDNLNRIALKNSQKTTLVKRPATLMNIAKTLYHTSQRDPYDEEMTFILLTRFQIVYDHLLTIHNDTNFVSMMLGKEASRAKAQIQDLKNNLINRYEALRAATEVAAQPAPAASPEPSEERTTVFNNASFITCSDLFRALSNKNVNLLIMDARNSQDFSESRIKNVTSINVPESCIQSGLSAHRLGKLLPLESIVHWEKRDIFDVIVLLDWNTSKTNFIASKLDKLKTILIEWDIDRNYNEKPVVLDCGYIEWLEMYPMLCTSPDVKYSKTNRELDELLNLDNIEYPTDSESKSHDIFNQELAREISLKPEDVKSREQLLQEEKAVIQKNKEIATELLQQEKHWKSLHDKIKNEYNITELEHLKREEKEAEEKITKLMQEEEDLLVKKSKLANDFNLSVSFLPSESQPADMNLKDIKDLQKEHLDLFKAREALSQDRKRLLDEARQAKKPRGGMAAPYKRPSVNRATKPKIVIPKIIGHIEGKIGAVNYGLTGLTNIRNTCYMNAIMQCIRHIPELMTFYCTGDFSSHLHRLPLVTNEVAHLIRSLWSNSYEYIRPIEFYNKFTSSAPAYRTGQHEDCMEFFLQLFTYLSEDCAFEIKSENSWTESQLAWYKQHNGKVSFYINNFYHQFRVKQICHQCRTTNLKFDIENVFYLTIPETPFNLQHCMDLYVNNFENIICKRCKHPKEIQKSIAVYPRILVIELKRHIQEYSERTKVATFRKNEMECTFPLDNLQVANCMYELNAIALHSGVMNCGHYTAACRNPLNKRWYLFNDQDISPLDITDSRIKAQAYAFFYSIKLDSLNNNDAPDGVTVYEPTDPTESKQTTG